MRGSAIWRRRSATLKQAIYGTSFVYILIQLVKMHISIQDACADGKQ